VLRRHEVSVDPATSSGVLAIARSAGYEAVVLPIRSVGVQGDGRTYAHPTLVTA